MKKIKRVNDLFECEPQSRRPERTISESKGFSLIELLVTISIIAILTTMGLVIYTEVQKRARDTQRMGDITAIAKAFETRYNGIKYLQLENSWFEKNDIPDADPAGKPYCACGDESGSSDPTSWPSSGCPGASLGCSSAWTQVSGTNPVNNTATTSPGNGKSWRVCTKLEATSEIFCKHNLQ